MTRANVEWLGEGLVKLWIIPTSAIYFAEYYYECP